MNFLLNPTTSTNWYGVEVFLNDDTGYIFHALFFVVSDKAGDNCSRNPIFWLWRKQNFCCMSCNYIQKGIMTLEVGLVSILLCHFYQIRLISTHITLFVYEWTQNRILSHHTRSYHMIYCMVYYAYFTQSRYAEVHVSGLKIYGYNARILFFFFLWWPTKPPFWFTKVSICYLWFVT